MRFLSKTSTGSIQLLNGISAFTGVANQIPETNAAGFLDAAIVELSATAGNKIVRNADGFFVAPAPELDCLVVEITGANLATNVNTTTVGGNILVFNTIQVATLFAANVFTYNVSNGALTTNFTGRVELQATVGFGVTNNMQLQGFIAKNAVRTGAIVVAKVVTGGGVTRSSLVIQAIASCLPGDVFTVRMARAPGATVANASTFDLSPTVSFKRIN